MAQVNYLEYAPSAWITVVLSALYACPSAMSDVAVPAFLKKLKSDGYEVAKKVKWPDTGDRCGRFLAQLNADDRKEWLDTIVNECLPDELVTVMFRTMRQQRNANGLGAHRILHAGVALPMRTDGVIFWRR